MTPGDILSLSFILALLSFSVSLIFITYFLVKALKSITSLADSLQETTQSIREKIQTRVISLIPPLVIGLVSRLFKKRG